MHTKRWIKRSTALLLTLVLVLGLLGTGASAASSIVANGYCGGQSGGKNLSWVLYSSGKLAFFGSGPMADYETRRDVPWYNYTDDITALSLSAGMTTIGNYAFYGCALEGELNLPAALTSIGDRAFASCCGLTGDLILPAGVTSIGAYAFGCCCGLTGTLTLPAELASIGIYAFADCCDLSGELTLPAGLTFIGDHAFDCCCSLSGSVEIPSNVDYLGGGVFSYTDELTSITVAEDNENYSSYGGVVYDKALTTAIAAPSGLPQLCLPETVTTIGAQAFRGCCIAGPLTLPEGITALEENAFRNCYYISEVSIPASLQSIGTQAFSACWDLKAFAVAAGNETYSSYNGLLYNKAKTELVAVPCGSEEMPALAETTKIIRDCAFDGCDMVGGHLVVPASVEYIGEDAMFDCDSISGIYFLGNAPEAFDDESFPDDITLYYIEGKTGWTDSEYYDETDGTWMYHPLLTWDGNTANLGKKGYCGDNLTWELSEDNTVLTISGSGAMYDYSFRTAVPWYASRETITKLVLQEGMTTISNLAFYGCNISGVVKLPSTLTFIGGYAFYRCTDMELECIPEGVTTIGTRAFCNCDSIAALTVPAAVTTIRNEAFSYCNNLTAITVAEGNESYSSYNGLLYNKDRTELVCVPAGMGDAPVLADTLTTIAEEAFYGCQKMEGYLIIPTGVSFLAEETLYDCDALSGICFMGNAPEVEVDAFYDNMPLYYLEGKTGWTDSEAYDEILSTWNGYPLSVWDGSADSLGKSGYCGGEGDGTNLTWELSDDGTLTISGTGAMKNYSDDTSPWYSYTSAIQEVVIGIGVTTVGEAAFANCSALTAVEIPDSATTIGESAFFACSALTAVEIPDNVTSIGYAAFSFCSALITVEIGSNVTNISNSAFFACTALTDVYYGGTEEQWNAMTIGENNDPLLSATIHFESQQPTVETFAIAGANMTLGNELVMNIMVKASDLAEGTYTAKISHGGKEPVELAFKTYNSTYCYVPYSVAAKEMTDTISVEVYNEDGVLVSEPFTRTVKQYAMTMLNNADQPDKLKSVIVDMLNYGTEAQKYFGYNEEAYANADVTAQQQAAYATADVECVNNQQAITNVAGASLSLEDSILLNVFFKVAYSETLTATISFTDYLGRDVTAEAELSKYGSMTKVVVDRIVLADAKRPVTVTVYDGETVVGQGVESVESYIARNLTNSSTGAINMAIMKFATSAYNYLGGTN